MRAPALLGLFLLASPSAAQTGWPPGSERRSERGAVFTSVSYLRSTGFLGFDGGTDVGVLTTRIGGEVAVVRRDGAGGGPGLTGTLGLALQAAENRILGISYGSGFRPQSAEVYGRLAAPLGRADLAATAGFVLDVGPSFSEAYDPYDPGGYPNSDTQNAARLGLDVAVPAGGVRVGAGVEGVLTFPVSYTYIGTDENGSDVGVMEGETDDGDFLTAYVGAAVPVSPSVEIGVQVVGMRRDTQAFGLDEDGERLRYARNVLSVVPHVRFARAGSPLSVSVVGQAPAGSFGEHGRYGVTVMGTGEPQVWLPLTVGLRYGL